MKHPLGRKERLNPKMIMSPMMTESLLWLVMSLRRQKRRQKSQQDYASRVFNHEPIDKDKWEPYEAIVNYVNRHFSKIFSNSV